MLTLEQIKALQSLIGWALDQDHDTPDFDFLGESLETNADELLAIARALSAATTRRQYLTAAQQLAENLPDSVPGSIGTAADALEFERVLREHLEALELERSHQVPALWLVPAPWDAPELAFPQVGWLGDEPWNIPNQLHELVESEPTSSDAEEMLGRVLLATGALYARGLGTLSQCLAQATVWERG
jgi:hypothetical protein